MSLTLPLVGATDRDEHFEALYRQFAPAVRHHVRGRIRDADLVEDVVQETFIRVYRFMDRLDADRPAWPWIRAIATTMASNARRGRRHMAEVILEDPFVEAPAYPTAPGPEDICLRREQVAALKGVLEELPARHRTVLVLKEVDDLSCAEIAALERTSAGTVKAVLARARAAFRRIDGGRIRFLHGGVLARWGYRWRTRGDRAASALPAVGTLSELLATRLPLLAGVLLVGAVTASGPSSAQGPARVPGPSLVVDVGPAVTTTTAGSESAMPGPSVASPRPDPPVSPPAPPVVGVSAVVPAGPVTAVGDSEVATDEAMTLDAEMWALVGTEEPGAGADLSIDCDGAARQPVCSTVHDLPR